MLLLSRYVLARSSVFVSMLFVAIGFFSVAATGAKPAPEPADACSDFIGKVSINEVLTKNVGSFSPFVELFVINDVTIPSPSALGWKVTVQGNQGNDSPTSKFIPAGNYAAGDFIKIPFTVSEIKNPGNDVLLVDELGREVDFLRFGGNRSPINPACEDMDDTRLPYSASVGGVCTIPDGTDEWDKCNFVPTPGGTNDQAPLSCALGGFLVAQPASALACPSARVPVGVTALCSDGVTTKTDYVGTVSLATGLAGSQFYLSSTGGAAVAQYLFAEADAGVASLYLYHPGQELVTVTAAGDGVSGSGSGTQFNAFGFLLGSVPAAMSACSADTVTLTAFGQVSGGTGCDVIQGFAGNKALQARFSYVSPATNSFGSRLAVNGSDISQTFAPLSVPVLFTAGVATLDISYPDAGSVDVEFRHNEPPYSGSPFSPMTAASSPVVVRPTAFQVSAYQSGGAVALNNALATGTPRWVAGQGFDVQVSARCSTGGLTPNYQPTSAVLGVSQAGSPGVLSLGAADYPAGAVSTPSFYAASALFSGGAIATAAASFSEVGSFTLTVKDDDYLGAAIPQSSAVVGRFYPSHFRLGAGTLVNRSDIPGCTDPFTYIGESFNAGFTLTAENLANTTTRNYQGSYAQLDSYAELEFGALSGGVDLTPRVVSAALPTISWINGSAVLSADLRLQSLATPEAYYSSFQLGVAPKDDDDVQLNAFDLDVDSDSVAAHGLIATTDLRYGRAVVDNAFGPESAALPIRLGAEYFDGLRFIANTSDNCTAYGPASLSLDFRDSGLYAGDGLDGAPSPETAITVVASSLVAGSSAAAPVVLTAPGEGNAGQVDLVFDVDSWLEFDWDGTGSRDPRGQATFGRYRGHDRIIYWREQLSN